MIKHIVIFQLDDKLATPEILNDIKNDLEALVDKIPELISLEAGINMNSAEKEHLVLSAEVENMEHLAIYAAHPDHVAVGGKIRPILVNRTCVDYQL